MECVPQTCSRVCACTICAHVRVSRVAKAFEACRGLRGMRARW